MSWIHCIRVRRVSTETSNMICIKKEEEYVLPIEKGWGGKKGKNELFQLAEMLVGWNGWMDGWMDVVITLEGAEVRYYCRTTATTTTIVVLLATCLGTYLCTYCSVEVGEIEGR